MEKWGEDFGSRVENECFRLPYGGALVGIIFGFFIIVVGLGLFLGLQVWRWIGPLVLIVVGILIIGVVACGLRRERG